MSNPSSSAAPVLITSVLACPGIAKLPLYTPSLSVSSIEEPFSVAVGTLPSAGVLLESDTERYFLYCHNLNLYFYVWIQSAPTLLWWCRLHQPIPVPAPVDRDARLLTAIWNAAEIMMQIYEDSGVSPSLFRTQYPFCSTFRNFNIICALSPLLQSKRRYISIREMQLIINKLDPNRIIVWPRFCYTCYRCFIWFFF